jgi:hypothetical protein
MLAKDERARPDWAELEEHVIKIEEDNANVNPGSVKENENMLEKIFGHLRSSNRGSKNAPPEEH